MRVTTPAVLQEAGFRIGPDAAATHRCGHLWGSHVLKAPGSPWDGGVFRCPDCPCTGTWDVSAPEEVRDRYR